MRPQGAAILYLSVVHFKNCNICVVLQIEIKDIRPILIPNHSRGANRARSHGGAHLCDRGNKGIMEE